MSSSSRPTVAANKSRHLIKGGVYQTKRNIIDLFHIYLILLSYLLNRADFTRVWWMEPFPEQQSRRVNIAEVHRGTA